VTEKTTEARKGNKTKDRGFFIPKKLGFVWCGLWVGVMLF